MTATTTPVRRLCGACLPDPRRAAATRFAECDNCGLHTMTGIDATAATVPPAPRAVPPTSHQSRKWWKGLWR